MALVEMNNPVTAVPELDFYAKTPVQTSIEKTFSEEIRPIAQLNTGGHIEFNVNNGLNEYIKLKETTLYVRFKVKLAKTTGTLAAADWDQVSLVNNFMHSLWSQIDLQIGDAQTTNSLQTYPYRAYFETILGSTPQSRKTHLNSTLFYEDVPANSDAVDAKMKLLIKPGAAPWDTGKAVECEGRLHLDLFMQERAMIGGTKLRLRLIPNRPEFYFMTGTDSKLVPTIQFEEMYLNVVKFRVSEEILMAQLQALNVSPVKYIISRNEVRSVTIDKGATSRNIENVIVGQLPRRVFIAFVKNSAYGGNYQRNPYNFENCNINSIACYVNGEQIPKKAYAPDFPNDKYNREFIELFRVAEQFDNDARMMVNKQSYKEGFTIFAFNLSPDNTQGYNSVGYVNVPRDGVMRFEIQFGSQLQETMNALILCEFDNQITIAEDRNAWADFR